jgi:acylphosphatase
MAVQAREVIYRGRVQGVGFRYTAREIARGFAVAGSVQNQEDGSVRLVAQGEPAEIDAFLAAVAERMEDNIRTAAASSAAVGSYRSFEIIH